MTRKLSKKTRLTTWISPNPLSTRFLSSSQPIPPAPTIRTRLDDTLFCKSLPRVLPMKVVLSDVASIFVGAFRSM